MRWGQLALTLVCILGLATSGFAAPGNNPKLDKSLNVRAASGHGVSRVIVTLKPGRDISADVKKLGGKPGKRLGLINGRALELPNAALNRLADLPAVAAVHLDRPTAGENNYTAVTTGARAAQQFLGFKGAGVGVAVIDSGVTGWHDDLTYNGWDSRVRTVNGQRVAGFVDFVNGATAPYDDNGHGTHVAGIIAGNGYDSRGARAGMAPAAHIVSLKVLDANGHGVISDVIAALEYAVVNKAAYNIRVINLSVGAQVTESYKTDPLTLAAQKAVDAGIVVVAAAGNLGTNRLGQTQYGAITAPGNAPWVLTVGASNHNGTVWRFDDAIARYSSRGPTAIDFLAKPDVVAPGTGIVSLAAPNSTMYTADAAYLLVGTVAKPYKPYLSLTGTSMAAPVVAGTAALMIEANPNLTPNLVKAILQYTAQDYHYNAFTQGGGFLNSFGAVRMARFFANAQPGDWFPVDRSWSKAILWGNHRITGGFITPQANAWGTNVVWGASMACGADAACENVVWGTAFDFAMGGFGENIVWGTMNADENVVWGTMADVMDPGYENIVWGTMSFDENVVWGTMCGDADCENIVWGSSFEFAMDENIVWGTSAFDENVVWGSNALCDPLDLGCENIVWGSAADEASLFEDPNAEPVNFDGSVFETLFEPPDSGGLMPETTVEPISGSTTTVDVGVAGGGF